MSKPDVRLDHLPVFDNHYGRPERWTGLRVDGLVAQPQTFSAADLDAFAQAVLTDDFRCEEGWQVDNQRWEGVPLAELLQVGDDPAHGAMGHSGHLRELAIGTVDRLRVA